MMLMGFAESPSVRLQVIIVSSIALPVQRPSVVDLRMSTDHFKCGLCVFKSFSATPRAFGFTRCNASGSSSLFPILSSITATIMIRSEIQRFNAKRPHFNERKKQFVDAAYKQQEYPSRLNFYEIPPTAEISLEDFERWAIDRLRGGYHKGPRKHGLIIVCQFSQKSKHALSETNHRRKHQRISNPSSKSTYHFLQTQLLLVA